MAEHLSLISTCVEMAVIRSDTSWAHSSLCHLITWLKFVNHGREWWFSSCLDKHILFMYLISYFCAVMDFMIVKISEANICYFICFVICVFYFYALVQVPHQYIVFILADHQVFIELYFCWKELHTCRRGRWGLTDSKAELEFWCVSYSLASFVIFIIMVETSLLPEKNMPKLLNAGQLLH